MIDGSPGGNLNTYVVETAWAIFARLVTVMKWRNLNLPDSAIIEGAGSCYRLKINVQANTFKESHRTGKIACGSLCADIGESSHPQQR